MTEVISILTFAVTCLILLIVVGVIAFTLLKMRQVSQKTEELDKALNSEVKSNAGIQGVIAKDRRRAEQIVNKIESKVTMPVLQSLVDQFGLEEEMESLQKIPFGMKILRERIEPLLQQYGAKAEQYIDEALSASNPTLTEVRLIEPGQTKTKMYKFE